MRKDLNRGQARFDKVETDIQAIREENQAIREEGIRQRHTIALLKWVGGALVLLLAACMPFALSHLYWA